MERLWLIGMLFCGNILYWYILMKNWKDLSSEGAGWLSTVGVILMGITTIMMFNLGHILNN